MDLNVGKELAALRRMPVRDLQSRYAEVFGETTNTHHKDWLVKRIVWRMQALAEGDLSERARRRAAELANDADLRLQGRRSRQPPRPTPRPRTRTRVLAACRRSAMPPSRHDHHPRIQGRDARRSRCCPRASSSRARSYKSLSAVAKAITGPHCNGYHFFRLGEEGGDR